jgi:transposase InsO family protein
MGMERSSYYARPRLRIKSQPIRKKVIELSEKNPRYGYRRITALLRRNGIKVNAKRVARLRREEGLNVTKKQRCRKRMGLSTAERQRAAHARHAWSWDFVYDQTENGSSFRILTLIDEHTRQCLAAHAAWSIRAVDVITVVEAAIVRYGAPEQPAVAYQWLRLGVPQGSKQVGVAGGREAYPRPEAGSLTRKREFRTAIHGRP